MKAMILTKKFCKYLYLTEVSVSVRLPPRTVDSFVDHRLLYAYINRD